MDKAFSDNPRWANARQCAAKSKRSGERCKRPACVGFHVCPIHGGKSPVGVGHPNWKHGERSKVRQAIGGRIGEGADREADLSFREDIAVLTGFLMDAVDRCDKRENAEIVADGWAAMKRDFVVWHQVREWFDAVGRAKVRELDRRVLAGQYVPVEDLRACVAVCLGVVYRHVRDRAEVAAVEREFYGWLSRYLRQRSGKGYVSGANEKV